MATEAFVFGVYSPSTGAPVTGASAGMSFLTYEDDLGNPLVHPTITEVGGGLYKFTPTFTVGRAICFVLSTAQNPVYLAGAIRPEDFNAWAYAPSPALIAFAVYDPVSGAPKTGVTNSFSTYEDQNGSAITPVAITEVGGGLYKFIPDFSNTNEIGFLISTGQNPLYFSGYTRVEDFSQTGFAAISAVPTPGQVTINFASGYSVDALSAFVSNPANWSITNTPGVTITAVNLTGNTIVLTTSTQTAGAPYTVNIPSGITANGGVFPLLGPFALSFTGANGDPSFVQARSIDEFTVDLYFAYPPIVARATDIAQYSISPALAVVAVQQMSSTWYRMTTGPQTIGQVYTVTWPLH